MNVEPLHVCIGNIGHRVSDHRKSFRSVVAAVLNVVGLNRVISPVESLTPWKNWATMAPELPRAPSSKVSAIERQHGAQVLFTGLVQHCERRPERQAQVRAGIAVGDREYVDAIEIILLADDAVYAGNEGTRQRVAVKVICKHRGQARCYSRGNRKVVP